MNEKNVETTQRINPFFIPYNTPHNTVPFDKIKTEDYEEAFLEGIRRDNEEIEKIINDPRSEEHTSELQSRQYLVCRLLLEKKKKSRLIHTYLSIHIY